MACLRGTRVQPVPIWEGEAGPGSRIRYRSGSLRPARALQSILAPYAPLETELGDPAADLEVWIH